MNNFFPKPHTDPPSPESLTVRKWEVFVEWMVVAVLGGISGGQKLSEDGGGDGWKDGL